ncbi:transporter substrate-binding domain-containing protein [Janthinobacterium sp. SUN073]|uniref:substrate-binding periplasmic protein n=1 Tax=Janthinobacterium sp. SUN073 TaxID=3004102 RepID=UPI0025B1A3EA|nr:transporter substrate-binding domain-containing protein [Janthinobacterium sp. SUN073]MDN2695585.1 transporter substrate-binding domain-containing protein [Janthinobacterium sp. SUN073]
MSLMWRFGPMVLAAVLCGEVRAQPLEILTAEIAPMAFSKDGKLTGFCVEVVAEIQRRLGDRAPMRLVPWARAYLMAQNGANVVLVCPKRTAERERQFLWVGPLLVSQTNFYARRGAGIRLGSVSDAKALPGVMTPRAFYSHSYLRQAGFANLEVVNNSATMLAMLLAGRYPLMVLDQEQLPALLEQAGVTADAVELVYPIFSIGSYVTFPLSSDPALVMRWQRTFERMKRDGAYDAIARRWFGALAK